MTDPVRVITAGELREMLDKVPDDAKVLFVDKEGIIHGVTKVEVGDAFRVQSKMATPVSLTEYRLTGERRWSKREGDSPHIYTHGRCIGFFLSF